MMVRMMRVVNKSKSDIEYDVYNMRYTSFRGNAVDEVLIEIKRDSDISIGDEIEVYMDLYDGSEFVEVKKFAGIVREREIGNFMNVMIHSFGVIIKDTYVDERVDGKDIAEIVEFLIEKYTDLNYIPGDLSGIVLERYLARGILEDVINSLSNVVNWGFWTDSEKNFYFRPEQSSVVDFEIEIGKNADLPKWEIDYNSVYNYVVVIGDVIQYRNEENFVSEVDKVDYNTQFRLDSGELIVDGYRWVDGDWNAFPGENRIPHRDSEDFVVWEIDRESRLIKLNKAIPVPGINFKLRYSYKETIQIELESSESVALYGRRSKILTKSSLKTFGDAEAYGLEYLLNNSFPKRSGRIEVLLFRDGVNVGDSIRVIDAENGINRLFDVMRIQYIFPAGIMIFDVGESVDILMYWQKSTDEKIRDLIGRLGDVEVSRKTITMSDSLLSEAVSMNTYNNPYKIPDGWINHGSFAVSFNVQGYVLRNIVTYPHIVTLFGEFHENINQAIVGYCDVEDD